MGNIPPLIVQEGEYRLVLYVAGGFSYERKNPPGFGWGPADDEPVTSPRLLDAIHQYRPNYPIKYAMETQR